MEAIVTAGCGLDVHAAVIVGCLLVGGPHDKPRKEVREFGTMTRDLEALRAWLREAGCTHVAMESTGVYWRIRWPPRSAIRHFHGRQQAAGK